MGSGEAGGLDRPDPPGGSYQSNLDARADFR